MDTIGSACRLFGTMSVLEQWRVIVKLEMLTHTSVKFESKYNSVQQERYFKYFSMSQYLKVIQTLAFRVLPGRRYRLWIT